MEPLVINNNSLSYKILNYLFKQSSISIIDAPPIGFCQYRSLTNYLINNEDKVNTTCDYRGLFVKLFFSMFLTIVLFSVLVLSVAYVLFCLILSIVEFISCIKAGIPLFPNADMFIAMLIVFVPLSIILIVPWIVQNKNKSKVINDFDDVLSKKFCRKIKFDLSE